MKPITDGVQAYVESKADALNKNIEDIFTVNIRKLENSLNEYQQQLESLNCPIDINEILSRISSVSNKPGNSNPNVKVNTFQLVLGLAGGDFDIAAGAFTGGQSNKTAIITSITKSIFEYIAIYVVAWPIGVAMLIKRMVDMVKGVRNGGSIGASELIKGLKAGTVIGLRDGKDKMMVDLEKKIKGSFVQAGAAFAGGIRNELETYRKSFNEMVDNLSKENFDVAQEKERTNKILAELVHRIINVGKLTMSKELSVEGIRALAETGV